MKGSFSKETVMLRQGSVKCQKLVLSTELIKSIGHRGGLRNPGGVTPYNTKRVPFSGFTAVNEVCQKVRI